MLPEFELLEPGSLDEALTILASGDGGITPLAGGTDILPVLRARRSEDRKFLSLNKLDELRGIECENGQVKVGALTTINEIRRHHQMSDYAPALVAAANVFAGHMLRNAATVAGNICNGSPSADTVPPLLSLDADITLIGPGGERTLPLDEFFTGYKENVLRQGELVSAVSWSKPPANSANLFYKLGRRKGDAITVVGVAVSLAAEFGICSHARIALGSVDATVKRAKEAEAMLTGKELTPELIEEVAAMVVEESHPIDDIRATGEYRKHALKGLSRRLISQAWEQLDK